MTGSPRGLSLPLPLPRWRFTTHFETSRILETWRRRLADLSYFRNYENVKVSGNLLERRIGTKELLRKTAARPRSPILSLNCSILSPEIPPEIPRKHPSPAVLPCFYQLRHFAKKRIVDLWNLSKGFLVKGGPECPLPSLFKDTVCQQFLAKHQGLFLRKRQLRKLDFKQVGRPTVDEAGIFSVFGHHSGPDREAHGSPING